MKLSRRDLPYAVATGQLGATTVAATMICAHLAGIEVFVTGGIGGVHRGAETSFDISADLQELARTPVAVVCAGAKAILDLPLTLEYLETHGVPVISVGQPQLRRLSTPDSGLPADFRLDTAEAQARFIPHAVGAGPERRRGGQQPRADEAAMPRADMDHTSAQALQEAGQRGIHGKGRHALPAGTHQRAERGRSLATNIALVQHNAVVGARLARRSSNRRSGNAG